MLHLGRQDGMRIELHDISKQFGAVQANDGISLTVESGSIHGLLGENGAGKTTLMKILSGYYPPDAGHILLDGHVTHFESPAEAIQAGIGMLHQDPLDPDASVGSLTVGERQQLELLRLLAMGVRVIILDEPTTGISAPQKVVLFDALRRLASEGFSVIFVSHKLDEVEALCAEVTVLRRGIIAGHAKQPFSADELVQMMFGQCLTTFPRIDVQLGDPCLYLEDVSLHSYRLDVDHVTLTVHTGEAIGLAGLEGSGQELLMRACAGLEHVHSGRLTIAGQDMTHAPYQRFLEMGVAFVPAARLEEGLIAGLTLCDHVALLDKGDGLLIDWQRAKARAESLISEYGIRGLPETPVAALSGGNQQRAILSLLREGLRLLILEHPTRGLDMESTRWVWNRLLQRRKQGTAILFTSTDLDELCENSDRIVVFSGGAMSPPIWAKNTSCEELGYLIGGRRV